MPLVTSENFLATGDHRGTLELNRRQAVSPRPRSPVHDFGGTSFRVPLCSLQVRSFPSV